MNQIELYVLEGFRHIADLAAYDHIVFIMALCASYRYLQWKTLLGVISFFSIGHSLTLALSGLKIITPNSDLVEFLIPCTIFVTAFSILFRERFPFLEGVVFNMGLAFLFGLVHGLGFSTYFKMLMEGMETNYLTPLLAFTLGIELGQVLIVSIFLLITELLIRLAKVEQTRWSIFMAGGATAISLLLMKGI